VGGGDGLQREEKILAGVRGGLEEERKHKKMRQDRVSGGWRTIEIRRRWIVEDVIEY